MQSLNIGYSPCPNDTYIMAGLAEGRVETPLMLKPVLADVETLNQWSLEQKLDVTKLSFAALGMVRESYGLLRSGGALGWGCGPLVVSRPGRNSSEIGSGIVAAPGRLTTARLLLSLYVDHPPEFAQMVFSDVMPAVSNGEADFGLVIHEGRFTLDEYGLEARIDLGEWWEQETGMPIPLGCIAIRRDLGEETARIVDEAIRSSLRCAREDPDRAMPYILRHAQEMDAHVTAQHIGLYVNEFSHDIGTAGLRAVETLFFRAEEAGLIPSSKLALLAYRDE